MRRLKAEEEHKKKEAEAKCQEATAQSNTQTDTLQDASTAKPGRGQSKQTKKKLSSKQQE
jgi:hypothetical protein